MKWPVTCKTSCTSKLHARKDAHGQTHETLCGQRHRGGIYGQFRPDDSEACQHCVKAFRKAVPEGAHIILFFTATPR